MEESWQEDSAGDEEQKRHGFVLPEKAKPGSADKPEACVELATMLAQIEAYFGKQARSDDLESLSFCLRHLFNQVDLLYHYALPGLDNWAERKQGDYDQETLQRQRIWLQLQTINRTLDRMAPLCHLLSDTIECLLDTLDDEEIWLRTLDDEDTVQLEQVKAPRESEQKPRHTRRLESRQEQSPAPISAERWERAVNTIMDQLLIWQERHHKLVSFPQQFVLPASLECNLDELDTAFAMLLDSAGAIFGDILPNFHLVSPEDREEIGALLFDLMQQSDQMLAQFAVTLEPFTRLIRHFAIVSEYN